MVPLAFARKGGKLKVKTIRGGREVSERLIAMGIVPGTEITLLKKNGHGPVLVKVGESLVGIGFGMAKKIEVEEEQ
ncbi:FeoA family protein [Venenivibrio stagnispumantis]|uniref:Ferrous iron transport protein A n=1 Tax=Venenivibrio stagnispumantis TaxID=407998 RepID=A0AA45WLJ3_9AQUI|nr:FeoA family protein [Venenivibrio stagnispumantis]MCW4573272.1 ferrous iron transport protein A [Venenivibrio stagnispumantis]SMP11445.1 ferrous iron transport protein A [Venenivibrio stagnispumantis]